MVGVVPSISDPQLLPPICTRALCLPRSSSSSVFLALNLPSSSEYQLSHSFQHILSTFLSTICFSSSIPSIPYDTCSLISTVRPTSQRREVEPLRHRELLDSIIPPALESTETSSHIFVASSPHPTKLAPPATFIKYILSGDLSTVLHSQSFKAPVSILALLKALLR